MTARRLNLGAGPIWYLSTRDTGAALQPCFNSFHKIENKYGVGFKLPV